MGWRDGEGHAGQSSLHFAAFHCISQRSQGVLGAADLAVHSLHSISVKKRLKKVFSGFISGEADAERLITTYNAQKKTYVLHSLKL